MPEFADTFGADYLTLNPDIVFGTAMLGRQFGVIKQAGLKRTGLREEIINDAGELVMLLIKNPGWEMMLTCAFDRHVSAPGLLEAITLPFLGIQGRVMEGAQITWDAGTERTIMIPVNAWDVMSNATAYRLSGGQRIAIGRAGVAPQSAPVLTVLSTTASSISIGIGLVSGAERYRVETSTDGTAWTLLTVTAANFATLSGLMPRETRRFRARGMDGEAAGPWSATLIATSAAADAAPSAQVIPALSHITGGTRITWPVVPQAESYEVEVRPDTLDEWAPLYAGAARECFSPVVVSGWESMTVAQRSAAFARQYRIRALNDAGAGPWRTFFATWAGKIQTRITPVRLSPEYFTWELGFGHFGLAQGHQIVVRIAPSPDMVGAVELDRYWSLSSAPGSSSIPTPGAWYAQGSAGTPSGWRALLASVPAWREDGRLLYVQARQANTRPGSQPGGTLPADTITSAGEWGDVVPVRTHPLGTVARYSPGFTAGGVEHYDAALWDDPGGVIDAWRIKLLLPSNVADGTVYGPRYDGATLDLAPDSNILTVTRDLARRRLSLETRATVQARIEDTATNVATPSGYRRYICAVAGGVEGPPTLLPASPEESPA